MDTQQRSKPGNRVVPKAALMIRSGVKVDDMEDNENISLVAISPVDEVVNDSMQNKCDTSAATTPAAAASTDSMECRRSSRKKIPKFDVRDLLLNKHRKPHKIQIEARFDSNAPSSTARAQTAASGGGGVNAGVSGAGSSNVTGAIIEKTSIIQRTPANVAHVHMPMVVSKDIFKPSQTSSLIVAQMASSSSASTAQRQQNFAKNIKAVKMTTSTLTTTTTATSNAKTSNIESDYITPKRRGRPPKSRCFLKFNTEQQQQPVFKNLDVVGNESEIASSTEVNRANENVKAKDLNTETRTPIEILKVEKNQKIEEEIKNQINENSGESARETFNTRTEQEISLDSHPTNFESHSNSGSSPPRKLTTPTRRGRERRSGRRLDDATATKTLEETFAEIAAKSSKAILELAVEQNSSDDTQQQQIATTTEQPSTESNRSKPGSINEDEYSEKLRKSTATTAAATAVDSVGTLQHTAVKKRGRPAKLKTSLSEESFSEEISLESNENLAALNRKPNPQNENEVSNDQKVNLVENLQPAVEASAELMSLPIQVADDQSLEQNSTMENAITSNDDGLNSTSETESKTQELVTVVNTADSKLNESQATVEVDLCLSKNLGAVEEELEIHDQTKPTIACEASLENTESATKETLNENEVENEQPKAEMAEMIEYKDASIEFADAAATVEIEVQTETSNRSEYVAKFEDFEDSIASFTVTSNQIENAISTSTGNQSIESNKLQTRSEKPMVNELAKDVSNKVAKEEQQKMSSASEDFEQKSDTKTSKDCEEESFRKPKKKHVDKKVVESDEAQNKRNEYSKKKHKHKSTDKLYPKEKKKHSNREEKKDKTSSNVGVGSEISNKTKDKTDSNSSTEIRTLSNKDADKKERSKDKKPNPTTMTKDPKETFEAKLFAIEMKATETAATKSKKDKSKDKSDKLLNVKSRDANESTTDSRRDIKKKEKDEKKKKHKTEKEQHKASLRESNAPAACSTPRLQNSPTLKGNAAKLETSSEATATSSSSSLSKKSTSKQSPTQSGGSASSHPKSSKRQTEKESVADKSNEDPRENYTESFKAKSKDKEKHARKERQQKLQMDLKSALETKISPLITEPQIPIGTKNEVNSASQVSQVDDSLTNLSSALTYSELELPPTPGSSCSNLDSSIATSNQSSTSDHLNASKTTLDADPFHDIAKFIEDGVNLLKRDYKLAENDEEIIQEADDAEQKDLNDEAIGENDGTNLSHKQTAIGYDYETPASTPAETSPSSSPVPTTVGTGGDSTPDNSLDTYYYSDGKRRSHRLKKITNAPKALEGRGLAKLHYSLEEHLTDLAEVEAKNAQFLKDMEERLSNFQVIKESEYHCERLVSREARKMICDCFLTPDEAERGELGCGEDCLNRLLMIECGVNCKMGERCTNKRFQKLLCAPCRVFRTEKKGFGIMADVAIHPGEFIMEYVGEVLDSDEFEKRRIAYSKDKNRHYYFMALRSDAIIDATTKGNISRFINHSCDPNAETQKWTVNGELRIGFFSRKTILPGEEITFDYQYQRYGREAQRCYCESANCRGWIGEEPDSEEGEQIDDDDEDEDDEDDDDEEDEEEDDVDEEAANALANDGNEELLKTLPATAAKANEMESDSADTSKQKFADYLGKISAKLDGNNKQKKIKEKKLRKKRKRKQVAAEKRRAKADRFLEDPDLEDEIDFLSRCGLKNQSDTLRFSRLMVRAKLLTTRLNLLAILREGELPCRRLFLDYHGLHLLHGWMNEDGRTDMTMREALLQTLECLPIVNKTILTDSKVYQALRNWCNNSSSAGNIGSAENSEAATATTEAAAAVSSSSSSSPSDESSKESGEQKNQKENEPPPASTSSSSSSNTKSEEIEKLAAKLLSTWNNLPEIFRIPKRERIEQMKEHEREADRQYAATIEATHESDQKPLSSSSTDRYQRDRFERRFGRPFGNGAYTGGFSGLYKKSSRIELSSEDTKNMSKEQRRELFAAKVALEEEEKRSTERRREFETKCSFFGLDPRITRPADVPFCVSDSGQWFNDRRQEIAKPPAFAHVPTPVKPKSTNPADYYLPKAAINLPPEWAFAITDQGKIYYYHLKHRIPQWEPPTEEQVNQTKWSDTEDESDIEEDESEDSKEIPEERIKEIEAVQSQEELSALLKKIAKEQRQARYKRLVEERPISPRREEDRVYNQIEMRKYKENKEKIKKRKEEIRRRRSEAAKGSTVPYMCTLGSLLDAASKANGGNGSASLDAVKAPDTTAELPEGALPIQDYLLSSDDDDTAADEEEDIDQMKDECNNSPLLEKIVQGDKIVDELDALTTKRQLKRPLPPHRELNLDLDSAGVTIGAGTTAGAAADAVATAESVENVAGSSSSSSNLEKIEYKKRRIEKKEKSKRSRSDSSDIKYRKLKEKFRCEIAGIIVQHLKPYRKESCTFARISSNEDFNHLARKLTHFVMIKELKYCDAVGQTLVVTDSVKNKSREFIKKYMAKYKNGYVKPDNDPDFKDIPYKI